MPLRAAASGWNWAWIASRTCAFWLLRSIHARSWAAGEAFAGAAAGGGCAHAAAIRGLRPWITSELEHNGLRAEGERVLDTLINMVRTPG